MFRLRSITLHKGADSKEYRFSDNAYVYGNNSVGKTAMVKTVDFVLGSSESLLHDGLDNIEAVSAYITNDKSDLWVKRDLSNGFFYKRTSQSGYMLVSQARYKEVISELITGISNTEALRVYRGVFGETPTFRSFTFVNFIDESGQGDLTSIFTRGKERRHAFRIRDVMEFFFNYKNVEKIYAKIVKLKELVGERNKLEGEQAKYIDSVGKIRRLFAMLGLDYHEDMTENRTCFDAYRQDFTRTQQKSTDDLAYLVRASHSLSEEMKLYSYMKAQSKVVETRRIRTEHLLSTLESIIAENEQYEEDARLIADEISAIQRDQILLSLSDYDSTYEQLATRKRDIDEGINVLKGRASENDYEQTMKMIALLEDCFTDLESITSFGRLSKLNEEIGKLKREISELKVGRNQRVIETFSKRLTDVYLNSKAQDVTHLKQDRADTSFSLSFDPFKQLLVARHEEEGETISYMPGSLARHTHLQMLVYLCMLEHLQNSFGGLAFLPLLVIDSADQAMEASSLEEVYLSLIGLAKDIGIQTIFISKNWLASVDDADLVDVTNGFNPFHLRTTVQE